uniref:Uncharacterized protein n=1 Tax=Panagrellus redivivus TaxID=6233 RepID=A0A7E4VXK2_PANRE
MHFVYHHKASTSSRRSSNLNVFGSEKPFFHRIPEASDLPCESYFDKNRWSLWGLLDKRLPMKLDALVFDVSCDSIRKRHYFPKEPLSHQEAKFPLAFARNVYKDYQFIEAELAAIYAPQNLYCYSIDSDANKKFKSRMHALSNCFDNVFIAPKEFSLNSDGHDMDLAHLACLEILRKDKSWKYVALLQNHDAVIKTNGELVQIYTWFNGSNDVGTEQLQYHLINTSIDWSFKALNLFKDSSKNTNQNITFTKGYNHCSLSRAAVDYIFDELNLATLVNNLNTKTYGIDEILIPTLNADDSVGLPGGFTRKCLDSGTSYHILTRNEIWNSAKGGCPSWRYRHSVCLIGVAFLSKIETWPAMFANKVYPKFDYGGYECMRERLFNRTYSANRLLPTEFLKEESYTMHLPVRYNRERQKSSFSVDTFNCNNVN